MVTFQLPEITEEQEEINEACSRRMIAAILEDISRKTISIQCLNDVGNGVLSEDDIISLSNIINSLRSQIGGEVRNVSCLN